MAIGRLQKTLGNELYQWAHECLTTDEAELQADPRFPRTDREIASKLWKTCKSGRFGLIFQQMVESERATSGAMPCRRAMLRKIFKHFQLERDRIGMLGERNLLSLKVAGKTVADLEARATEWLWSKVELAIQLDHQKRNRAEFDKQLKLKPAEDYSGTCGTLSDDKIAGAPAPTPNPKPKATPKNQGPGGEVIHNLRKQRRM